MEIEDESKDERNDVRTRSNLHFNPKVEFPTFDGTNARKWIKKCVNVFFAV